MNRISGGGIESRAPIFGMAMLFALMLAVGIGRAHGAEHSAPDFLNEWTLEKIYQPGVQITTITEPGDETAASRLAEFIFEFPNGLVDLESHTNTFLTSGGIEVRESLPVDDKAGVYQKSFLGNEKGKDQVFRVDVITLEEAAGLRLLLIVALPEKYERIGGRDTLLETFAGGRSIDALTRSSVERHALLHRYPDDHALTTNSRGETFTQGHFKIAVDVGELLAGRQMSGADVQWLLSKFDEEWELETASIEEDYREVATFLEQAKQADPAERRAMTTTLYATVQASGERSTLLEIVKKLNPVHAEKNGDILTERALEARLRSAKTVLQLEGKSASEIDDAALQLREEIIASFDRAPDAERQALQAAESRWLRLLTSVSTSSPEERLQRLDQARTAAGSDPSTLNIAHALEEGTILTVSDFKEKIDRLNKRTLERAIDIHEQRIRNNPSLTDIIRRAP